MRRLAVQQAQNRKDGQQAPRDYREGVPGPNDRSRVSYSDLDSIFLLESLPLVTDEQGCCSGIGVGEIARANSAVAAQLAICSADFLSAEYCGQSAGGRSCGCRELVFRGYNRERVASIDLDNCRPRDFDRAQYVHKSYRGIVHLDRRPPKSGPADKGKQRHARQVFAGTLETCHNDRNRGREAKYPNDDCDHLIEAGVEHPSIVAGEGA